MRTYNTVPWDVAICAWCTNPFERTKQQADRKQRYCGQQCAGYGIAVKLPDDHWSKMARAARASYSRNRAARLAKRLKGKTVEQAYRLGRRDLQDELRKATA